MAVIARGTPPTGEHPSIPNLELTRLHVTPFNPNLLNAIIPPSILPSVQNISYHSLQTFPEKSYGFFELPKMDAEKIKKKLNGSILKGSKIRIEEARPSKERDTALNSEEITPQVRKEKVEKGSRKRKRHEEILPGVELRDRKVQRGWTAPSTDTKKSDKRQKDKKDKKSIPVKSKFTSQPECLFKTSLPANVASNVTDESSLSALKKGKKSRNLGQEVMVHEFSKTTKHATFLRGSGVPAGSTAVSEFVEGKGWINKDGNIVETESFKTRSSGLAIRKVEVGTDSSSSVSDTSEEEESSEDEGVEDSILKTTTAVVTREASVTSSSGSSSEEDDKVAESNSDSDSASLSENENEAAASPPPSRPTTSSGHPSLSLKIPHLSSTPIQVHPLEALYKKSKTTAPTSTPSFSFFNADDANEDIDASTADSGRAGLSIPMTPFTQQDFEFRGQRSAAPTPDTAHPGKSYTMWPSIPISRSRSTSNLNETNTNSNSDDDDEEEESQTSRYTKSPIPSRSSAGPSLTPTAKGAKEGEGKEEAGEESSDFQKWFYEHRGEANRAWKKRRKVAGKEKRHGENKKRRD